MASNDKYFNIALAAFFVVVVIGALVYFRPRFFSEGFTTIAIDGETAPKCFLRDADAQRLISKFAAVRSMPPASDKAMALAELTLIIQKMLCIDADITGAAMGPYSTYQLPYATAHDIEPAAEFVNRCLKNAVRSRDIEMAMGKFEDRGYELLNTLCGGTAEHKANVDLFRGIAQRAGRNISEYCLKPKNSLDRPAGPRDPAYNDPGSSASDARPYEISGGGKQWI
jgi:hypothetical protein